MKKNYAGQMKRLQAALDASGLDYEAMAKRVGIKAESLRKAWKGYQGMSEPVLRSIEAVGKEGKKAHAPADTGSDDHGRNRAREDVTAYQVETARMRQVPIISRAQAGQTIQWEELLEQEHEFVSSDCPDKEAVALQVEGESMEPAYKAGDIIIVMPNFKPVNESLVVVRLNNGDVMFKELVFLDDAGERFKLLSYNPRFPAREVSVEQIDRMMPVYSVVRKVWSRDKWQAQRDALDER